MSPVGDSTVQAPAPLVPLPVPSLSVSTSHFMDLIVFYVLAVSVQVAARLRGRGGEVYVSEVRVPLADDELFSMRLSEWTALSQGEAAAVKRKSRPSLLQEITVRGKGTLRRSRLDLLREMTVRS